MARHVECPCCGKDITSSYEPADHSVGIWDEGWYCDDCAFFVDNDPQDDDYLEERRRDRE